MQIGVIKIVRERFQLIGPYTFNKPHYYILEIVGFATVICN